MPSSIGIAAFVVGLGLVIAAIIGQRVKVVALELPDLSGRQRLVIGGLGLGLAAFGLLDRGAARVDDPPASAPTTAAVTRRPAVPSVSTRVEGPTTLADDLPCLSGVAAADVFTVDVERAAAPTASHRPTCHARPPSPSSRGSMAPPWAPCSTTPAPAGRP